MEACDGISPDFEEKSNVHRQGKGGSNLSIYTLNRESSVERDRRVEEGSQ